ncbi:MAG: VWA domain-containing protein [Pyrinomonadaceae bacterium]
MRVPNLLKQLTIFFTAFCASAISATAQQPQNQNPDVIRVNTSLVQTDVMVFDKQGKFVDELKREQFVLKVDGKPREISFFELVKAGSSNEEAQLAAARGAAAKASAPVPLDRGRTVFFFIDDLHLSQESTHHTKKLLTRFVEREMGQNDQVVFIAASGQIGFLQQLTDNKAVLLKAIERVTSRQSKSRDMQSPPMSEYQALQIDQRNEDVKGVYVDYMLRENPMLGRALAEEEVRARAVAILRFSAAGTTNTLSSLQKMVEDFRAMPGRKVLFLLSDGFLINSRNSDVGDQIRRVTASAASSSFVIYSIDARGLPTADSDASSPPVIDFSGRLSRGTMGELAASQDGLNALANDTGGRAFFNSNALSAAVTRGLKEASVYYLLAWRPEPDEERNPKYQRLEVSVVDRSDLFVRSRTGVGEAPSKEAKSKPQIASNRSAEMREALRSVTTQAAFPVEITLNFVNTVQAADVLVTSIKIAAQQLTFADQAGVPTADVLVAGLVLNTEGKVVSTFDKILTVRAKSADTKNVPDIHYTSYATLKPGLYQVRVAATDKSGGPVGTAWDWIEITDFSAKTLALSSLIVGERKTDAQELGMKVDPTLDQVQLNVSRRFKPSSYLRFVAIVYNATKASASQPGSGTAAASNTAAGKPDLAVQVQVFRDNEPVLTDPLHKINIDGTTDLARIQYAAELNLEGLSRGKYVLQLTVIDRVAKASASQRVRFQVD